MNKLIKLFTLAFLLLPTLSYAGTGGQEFAPLAQKFQDWIEGFGGMAIAIASIGLGAFKTLAPGGSPISILIGVGAAVLLTYSPELVRSIFSATI